MYLDLGKYSALARVTLNGRQLDLFWTENQQVEITGLLKRTNNRIEIEVTNTWHNRLTGDAALPENERLTSVILSPDKNAALSPSGLVGPVRIMKEVEE